MGFRLRRFGQKLKRIDDESSAPRCDALFRQWLATPYGEYLLSTEKAVARELLEATAGYRVMELAVSDVARLRDMAPQLHRFALTASPQDSASALSDMHALPLPSSVVDVAILHHVLDYCRYPHETLKEAGRVVLPSGALVVVGFNPVSTLGLLRWPMRVFSSGIVWQNRGLSPSRVVDWLRLLGFQCEKLRYGAYNPPFTSRGVLARLAWSERLAARLHLPLGSFYIIVARKQRLRPIVTPQEWLAHKIKPNLAPQGQVTPANRREGQSCRKR